MSSSWDSIGTEDAELPHYDVAVFMMNNLPPASPPAITLSLDSVSSADGSASEEGDGAAGSSHQTFSSDGEFIKEEEDEDGDSLALGSADKPIPSIEKDDDEEENGTSRTAEWLNSLLPGMRRLAKLANAARDRNFASPPPLSESSTAARSQSTPTSRFPRVSRSPIRFSSSSPAASESLSSNASTTSSERKHQREADEADANSDRSSRPSPAKRGRLSESPLGTGTSRSPYSSAPSSSGSKRPRDEVEDDEEDRQRASRSSAQRRRSSAFSPTPVFDSPARPLLRPDPLVGLEPLGYVPAAFPGRVVWDPELGMVPANAPVRPAQPAQPVVSAVVVVAAPVVPDIPALPVVPVAVARMVLAAPAVIADIAPVAAPVSQLERAEARIQGSLEALLRQSRDVSRENRSAMVSPPPFSCIPESH